MSSEAIKSSKKLIKKHQKHEKNEKRSAQKLRIAVSEDMKIDESNYFDRNEHFRVWLKTKKHQNFEDLSSRRARKIFSKEFVKAYNKGKLDALFYNSEIPPELRDSFARSQHQWSFQLSSNERTNLMNLKEDVDNSTRSAPLESSSEQRMNRTENNVSSGAICLPVQQQQTGVNRRRFDSSSIPEKAPAGSFERRIDQKRTIGAAMHGAHDFKESNQDGLLLVSENDALGGSGFDELQRLKQRQYLQQEKKRTKAIERSQELIALQQDRDNAWKERLQIGNLQEQGGKIVIRPRDDS